MILPKKTNCKQQACYCSYVDNAATFFDFLLLYCFSIPGLAPGLKTKIDPVWNVGERRAGGRENQPKSIPQKYLICFLLCYNSPCLLPGCTARIKARVIFRGGGGGERGKDTKAGMMGRRECLYGNR